MKRRWHNTKTAPAVPVFGGAGGVQTLPKGKVLCNICAQAVSVTKAGVLRKHRIRTSECPGSGMRA